jgi:hypothetical protein
MMHLIASDEASVLRAIEQCHEVGFEMLILSFGSGFNLESDLIHGRRPDASGLDWCLHVNPQLTTQGMLVVYNPTSGQLRERLKVPMHYTGLRERADVRPTNPDTTLMDDLARAMPISPLEILELEVNVPAYSMRSYTLTKSPNP